MTTSFASRQAEDIRKEVADRFAKFKAQFGENFVDVVILSFNRHGKGKEGYTCMFSGKQTSAGPDLRVHKTLIDFVRYHFGHGNLKKIDSDANGVSYAVIKAA